MDDLGVPLFSETSIWVWCGSLFNNVSWHMRSFFFGESLLLSWFCKVNLHRFPHGKLTSPPENQWLEDEFPVIVPFYGTFVRFQGCLLLRRIHSFPALKVMTSWHEPETSASKQTSSPWLLNCWYISLVNISHNISVGNVEGFVKISHGFF